MKTLTGQVVLFTGRVFVDGAWLTRAESTRVLQQRGITVASNSSRRVSLLVAGDLSYQILTDQTHQRSAKILFAVEERRSGNHLCVITATGYSGLLRGNPAYCLDLEGADPPVELSGPFMS